MPLVPSAQLETVPDHRKHEVVISFYIAYPELVVTKFFSHSLPLH